MNKRIVLKSILALTALATTAASALSRNAEAEPDLPAPDAQEAQARYSSRYFFIRPRRRMFLFRKRRSGPPLPARPAPRSSLLCRARRDRLPTGFCVDF